MDVPGAVSTALRITRAGATWLKERILRPKLQIVVDPGKTYVKKIIQRDPTVYSLLLHVVVRNEGAVDARGCQGYLDRIDRWREEECWVQQKSYVRPDVLDWANLDFEPQVIPRKAKTGIPPESTQVEENEHKLNLVETDDAWSQIFRVCTQSHGKGSKTEFPPGRYRLHIRVTSRNASTVAKEVVIEAPDRWDQIHFVEYPPPGGDRPTADSHSPRPATEEIHIDRLETLPTPEAVRIVFMKSGKPMRFGDVMSALEELGLTPNESTVRSALGRLEKDDLSDIRRVSRGVYQYFGNESGEKDDSGAE